MLDAKLNEILTRTGPGTPGGDFMRRYWHPVALSSEVTPGSKPKQVRILGEDLVLFRDDGGRPGLVGMHCSHRLTSLAYGRVEDGGIRCPFHGWLYDVEGHCLEQPAEPEGSTFKDRIKHSAYPCQELGGLIFTYMGPLERQPLLPRYECLVREDGTRKADYYQINSNYVQNFEGGYDTPHGAYLHSENWSIAKHQLASWPKPRVEFEETDFGIAQRGLKASPGDYGPTMGMVVQYLFLPSGMVRVDGNLGERDVKRFHSWFVPIDDTHCYRFLCSFAPFGPDGEAYDWPHENEFTPPGPRNDYFRDYDRYDTISGIPSRTEGSSVKGFMAQDSMVNESQGPIVDRSRETLGEGDAVIMAMRLQMLKGIADVQQGGDPKHVIRESSQNTMIRWRSEAALQFATRVPSATRVTFPSGKG